MGAADAMMLERKASSVRNGYNGGASRNTSERKMLNVYLTVYGITKKLESSISGSWRPLFESHDVEWRGGNGAKAEGSFTAVCALSNTTALAKARGLRGLLQAP